MLTACQALKIGPAEIVYAGRNGYPAPGSDDYGVRSPAAVGGASLISLRSPIRLATLSATYTSVSSRSSTFLCSLGGSQTPNPTIQRIQAP
jgi:hypothetical protein